MLPINSFNATLDVQSTLSPALLHSALLLLGLRDQQTLITQATSAEHDRARSLKEAYEKYLVSPDPHSTRTLYEALTAAIEQLNDEHVTALGHVQEVRAASASLFTRLKNWFGFEEDRHYLEIADKISVHLQTLLSFRDTLIPEASSMLPNSHITQRRLLQQEEDALPVTQQFYCYPSGTCELSQLRNGVSGFVLNGETNDRAYLVRPAGDVNGDGFDDIMVGAPPKKAYVIFGSNSTMAWGNGSLSLNSLADGQRGFVFVNPDPYAASLAVSSAGDINGDGLADFMIGSSPSPNVSGKVYIFFGNSSSSVWGNGTLNVTSLMNGQRGFVLQGDANDTFSSSLSNLGDIDGDGLADIIIAAPAVQKNYVVFGSSSSSAWGNGLVSVSSLVNGQRGFTLIGGEVSDQVNWEVRNAGDVNGDGLADMLVNINKTYVVFGSKYRTIWGTGTINIDSLMNGLRGFALGGIGAEATTAGDINGDGCDDLVMGSYFLGKAYVVFGSAFPGVWGTGYLNVASLNGQRGFILDSTLGGAVSVAAAGDINGDGFGDLVMGIHNGSPPNRTAAGQTYVFFGSNSQFSSVLNMSSIVDMERGILLQGETANDQSGGCVITAGDVNGDGLPDLMIGAQFASSSAGKSYIVLSSNLRRFTANSIRIGAYEVIRLSLQNIDISLNINQVRIDIVRANQGHFARITSPTAPLAWFSYQDLVAGLILFLHTGNTNAPSYRLCFVDIELSRQACSSGQVDFLGFPPVLTKNELAVSQGLSILLQLSDLSASDQDNPPNDQIFFIIDNLTHGNFTYSPATNTTNVTTVFTQQAVLDGLVRFNHDGTRNKPTYTVRVNDTKTVTAPRPAAITFIYEPELNLTTSEIILDQGQGTALSPLQISATDVETFYGSLIIEVGNITAGHFAYATNLNYTIFEFQQLSVITGIVQFVQDGSDVQPGFSVRVFDGVLRSPWETPRISMNYRPVLRHSIAPGNTSNEVAQVNVLQGEDFDFTLDSVRFRDDSNGTLTYRALLKGGSPLPLEIRFIPPDRFSGNIASILSFNIEVEARDPRGVTSSAEFILSSVTGGFDFDKLYTALSTVGGIGLTILAYLWLRRRIAKHRRDFPLVNDVRKVLNLEYYDFTRFDGDSYKTKLLKLQWDMGGFYSQLTPPEQKSFAVCVGEIIVKRGLVSRSNYGGGLFGVCCVLNVGWPNQLNLKALEVQSSDIAEEAINNWKQSLAAKKEHQKPLNRWPYYSPSKGEKCKVFFCCAKPFSAGRFPVGDVALEELKTRDGTDV